MINKNHLQEQFDDLILNTGMEARYLHFKTVSNFLFHFNEIINESDRIWIANTIQDYLAACKMLNGSLGRTKSVELYEKYLDRIGDYYAAHLKFFLLPHKVLFSIFYIVVSIVIFFLFEPYATLIVFIIFLFRAAIIYSKYCKRRVYGLYY